MPIGDKKDRQTNLESSGPRRRIVRTLLSLFALYAGAAMLLVDKIIYPFSQTRFHHPSGTSRLVNDHIPVTIFDAGPDAEIILYLQGNIASRAYSFDDIIYHHGAGFTVITMNWPGAEGRSGPISEGRLKAEAMEVMRAIPDLIERKEPAIHIHGYSMGSGIAAHVAAEISPVTLTLQASYSSLCEIMTSRSALPACLMPGVDRWDNRPYAEKIDVPVLLIHGLEDTLIPPEYDRRLAHILAKAGNPPQVTTYPNVDHISFSGSGHLDRIHRFIKEGHVNDPVVDSDRIDDLFRTTVRP